MSSEWIKSSLGLLTALGADAPEIAAALAALVAGAPEVGRGVVLGSNLFNLAMLLGLSALLTGRVHMRRQGLVLDGSVAVFTLVLVAALLLGGGLCLLSLSSCSPCCSSPM